VKAISWASSIVDHVPTGATPTGETASIGVSPSGIALIVSNHEGKKELAHYANPARPSVEREHRAGVKN
jgi:hypothetical protein